MSDTTNILIYEKMQSVQYRILEVIKSINLESVGAVTKTDFMTEFKKLNYKADLIILDVSSNIDIEFVEKINHLNPDIPIIVFTDKQDKEFFIKLLKVGVQDFIIKPFTNEIFIKKVLNFPFDNYISEISDITFEPIKYLRAEYRKAEKGNFPLTVILFAFLKSVESGSDYFIDIRDNIFKEFQSLFWDTDLFFQLDRKYVLAILPFCTEDNIPIVESKVSKKLTEMTRTHPSMKDTVLESVSSIFPENNSTAEKVLGELVAELHRKYPEMNLQINLK
ncbi:MAG: response regulator [Clostridiales bacterium]|nr:response regulator [Clostridiales bacterium]